LYSACKCNYYFSLFTFHFKAWLLQALNGVLVLDDLDGAGLACAAGDEVELCFGAEVSAVEVGGLAPLDVHLGDVGGGEGICGFGADGGDAGGEGAEVAEGDAVALEDDFAQAADGLGEHGGDVALVVDATVVADVLCEVVEAVVLADLCLAVGLGFGDVLLLGAGLCGLDGNAVVDHVF